MAVDLYVQDDNNITLDVPTNDLDLQLNQPVMVDPNYEHLTNLPQINHVTLIGDKSFADLGLVEATEESSGLMSAEDKTILDNIDETYVDWEHVDHALNSTSENPIDNKTVTHMFDRMGQDIAEKQDLLTFDDVPTEGSSNPVTSDGIYDAIVAKTDVVVYTGFCDYSVGSEVQPAGLNGDKTRADIIADIEANKIVIIRIEDLYMDVYDFVYAGKQNLFNEPPLSNEIAYTFIYNKATDNKCVKLLVASFSNSIQIQKWMDAEVVGNKVTSLSASSTNTEYPSAKCVYDAVETVKGIIPTKTSDLQNDGSDETSTYVEADELATVATSGSYNDLLDKPTIPAAQVNSDWNANSGVAQILNKPTIPAAQVNSDWNASSGVAEILNKPSLATVATSGNYNDLLNQPSIPAAQVNSDWNANSGVAEILNKPSLAAVATSGSYNDLQDKPTIPAAQVNADWNANSGVAEILNKPSIPAAGIPSGGNAGQILKKNSATDYDVHWADQTQYYPSGYSTTAADKQTKQIACSSWTATAKSYLHILLTHANTYAGKIYFTVNAVNTYEVWINGAVSSATNYSLPAGTYIIYFDGSAFQVRTDGIIPASVNGTAARIPYGECDSTSTSTAFTATVPGITELKDGVTMLLYNGVVTSASGFTIDINGLGAKPSYSNMALGNPITPTNPTRDTTIFNINYAFLFVYSETLVSGGCWIGYRGYDANTNTIGYQLRTNYTTMPTADKFYRYRLLFTSADGTKWVPANTSTSTNATAVRTPNTRAIDPFGEIVWYGTTTAIEANANVTAAQLWQEYYGSYTNIGYSFNNTGSAATMTANKPIYIKCTPQADGSAIIDPTTPYTQTLPTTDDGKIYIYLGRAYNATNFEITMNHPVYYHDGTGIRIWCGGRLMPNPPSTDGTYTLQCTVSNGTVTYNWI